MSSFIVDSNFASLEEAIHGTRAPASVQATLALVQVGYIAFDGFVHFGQLVVHKDLAAETQQLFAKLCVIRFPIERVVPIVAHGWDDHASMLANNTSAFNYRLIADTDRLSIHAFGRAIDINPKLNPFLAKDGTVSPAGATYDRSVSGTLTADGYAVRFFEECGWEWGGRWVEPVDYQHFEKL